MKVSFINDKYKVARGGHSRLLKISCEKCGKFVCYYQKDGPGNLRRMYIDRILASKVSMSKKELVCPGKHILGSRIVYGKEERPAFRLFVDAAKKEIASLTQVNK